LKTPKAHCLQGQALFDVTQATLVAQLLYVSLAWSWFIKSDDRAKLQSISSSCNKAACYGLLLGSLVTNCIIRQHFVQTWSWP